MTSFFHAAKMLLPGAGSAPFSPIHHRVGLWKLTWALIKGCAARVNKTKWLTPPPHHLVRLAKRENAAAGNCVFILIIRQGVCVCRLQCVWWIFQCRHLNWIAALKAKQKPGHPLYLNTQIHNVGRRAHSPRNYFLFGSHTQQDSAFLYLPMATRKFCSGYTQLLFWQERMRENAKF